MTEPRKTLLLLGATSDIGRATALAFAQAGWDVQLAARDEDGARRNGDDIALRTPATVSVHILDVLETQSFGAFVDGLPKLPDTVVSVIGEIAIQGQAETDLPYAAKILRTNFEGPALLLGLIAERFLARGRGTIVGVSSVAGDRGRGANYIYGSAKAGLSAYLSGLRSRLAATPIRVVTVKPGFVRTRMTAARKLPPVITAEADEVGRAILAAAERKRGREIVYVRPIWRLVMLVISSMPEFMFKRLRF